MNNLDDKDLAIIAVTILGIIASYLQGSAEGVNMAMAAIAGIATGRINK